MDLDCPRALDASSRGLCRGRPQSSDLSKVMGTHSESYRRSHCYSDFWEAYANVIPESQHTACGKESGETAHVERWNNTLRQRLARFVRKTLSFSKSDQMHEICLRLFIHRYNLSLRPT